MQEFVHSTYLNLLYLKRNECDCFCCNGSTPYSHFNVT